MTFKEQAAQVYAYVLLLVYGVFLCSYFIFDEYGEPYRFFARVLFVLGLFVIDRGIRGCWRHPLFLFMVAYLVYLLLSGLWSEPMDWYRLGQKATISLYLLGFVAITFYLANWNRAWFERMLQACTLFAAGSALAGIFIFYSEHPFPETRMLTSVGALTNINEFANVYGVFAVLAMGFAVRSTLLPVRLLFLAAVISFICVAWFGQSRMAFMSILLALGVLGGLSLQRGRNAFFGGVACLVLLLLVVFPDVLQQAFLRGESLRFVIWAQVWTEIQAAPLFGHGLVSELAVDTGVRETIMQMAHNAYLQVLWHGGAVGLLVFLLFFGAAFRFAWIQGQREGDYRVLCILLFAACAMMTGVDTLITRPRDQWMLFWFPMVLLLAYQGTAYNKQPAPGPGGPGNG